MQFDHLSQEELIKFISQNDLKAIEYVYKKMYAPIAYYILKNNGSSEEAQDLYQDAFIILLQKIQKGNFILTSKLETFLFGIVKRLWFKQLRSKKNPFILSLESEIAEIEIAEDNQSLEELEFEIWEYELSLAMQELCEKCRKLLQYFYYDKKKFSEFYRLIGYKSIASAKNQKVKCMQKLKEILKQKKFSLLESTSDYLEKI